jgi:hypothetical protein
MFRLNELKKASKPGPPSKSARRGTDLEEIEIIFRRVSNMFLQEIVKGPIEIANFGSFAPRSPV